MTVNELRAKLRDFPGTWNVEVRVYGLGGLSTTSDLGPHMIFAEISKDTRGKDVHTLILGDVSLSHILLAEEVQGSDDVEDHDGTEGQISGRENS